MGGGLYFRHKRQRTQIGKEFAKQISARLGTTPNVIVEFITALDQKLKAEGKLDISRLSRDEVASFVEHLYGIISAKLDISALEGLNDYLNEIVAEVCFFSDTQKNTSNSTEMQPLSSSL